MTLLLRLPILTLIIVYLTSCDLSWLSHKKLSQLEQIKQAGVLNVITRLDPTTYYEGAEGFSGLEYDLATLFAKHLGVEANFIIPDSFDDILKQIANGKGDVAAAGLTVTAEREKTMRFAPPYHNITEQIIYRSGKRRPKKISDLSPGILETVKGTSHIDSLQKLKIKNPELTWNENSLLDTDGLLYLVNQGLIDYTIADSNQVALIRRFYPKLNIAFDITESRQLAWALTKSDDLSLYNETIKFFTKIKKNKTLAQLIERHYGHASSLNYVGLCKFQEHKLSRLPSYQKLFEDAAKKHQMDWRLLAAIGYQESHWLENAISPTGVQGLMMLTKGTAKYLGVKNRIDPAQSIYGGARYFRQRLKKLPARISQPDRTWMALAAYNVGYGHLEDARVLTQKRGGNPDKWVDVKNSLPLLSKKQWHSKTKHGYARGEEPVRYVENVRSYYDLLIWSTEENIIGKNAMEVKQPPEMINKALEINSPAL